MSKRDLITATVPRHIAIVMDGNRRWAKERGLSCVHGHWEGAERVLPLVRMAAKIGVEVLTLYSFSTENWARSREEVEDLMKLISSYLRSHSELMKQESIRLETIGDLSKLPAEVQNTLQETKKETSSGKKIKLVLALNYGSRDEIRRAFVHIAEDIEKKKLCKEEVTEELISSYLDTAELGDPDLFIRTSGELRLSNFLLWQLSYTEVYITKALWPDFTPEHLLEAIQDFQRRDRRLGGM